MSLLDLKKAKARAKGTKTSHKNVNVDTFIEDAERYAQGKTQKATGQSNIAKSVAEAIQQADEQKKRTHFKCMTYSLSEHAIRQMAELAKAHEMPKSRLLRVLLNAFAESDEATQKAIIDKHQVP